MIGVEVYVCSLETLVEESGVYGGKERVEVHPHQFQVSSNSEMSIENGWFYENETMWEGRCESGCIGKVSVSV